MVEEGITPGLHQAVIESVEPGQAKAFQSEELEDVIRIHCNIAGKRATYKVRAVWSDRSNLFKLVKNLNPGAISSGTLKTPEDIEQVVANLKGRECIVKIEEQQGSRGPYRKVGDILSAISNGAQAGSAPIAPTSVEALEKQAQVEDDDIPF